MQPFYQDEYVTLYTGDNRDLAPLVACCDHILTDPPFAEETHEGARTNPETALDGWRSGGNEGGALIDFDSLTFDELLAYVTLWFPKAAQWSISFLDWRYMQPLERVLANDSALRFVRHGIWNKPNGAPQFTGDRPATGWEAIAILHRCGGRMIWNGGGKRAVWTANKINGVHKSEKPQDLLQQLLRDFTQPNDLVVDPFAGSYAVARACKRLGRRCIAIEQNPKYADWAAKECAAIVPLVSAQRVRQVRAKTEQHLITFEEVA